MELYNPTKHGLSVSALSLWHVDKTAFYARYILGYTEVMPWQLKMAYGTFVQAGIEGYVKLRTRSGSAKFIQNCYEKDLAKYGYSDEMFYAFKLACIQCDLFVCQWKEVLDSCTDSERNLRPVLSLPSGRHVVMNCYLDGEGDRKKELFILENKVRAKVDREEISQYISLDLQLNYYLLAYYLETGQLPKKVHYFTQLRPNSFGYRGPRRKKKESIGDYHERIKTHIQDNPDYYTYRYVVQPTEASLHRFCQRCLYPMVENLLDWYEYVTADPQTRGVNKVDYMTPYGIYNPFTNEVQEAYRQFRLSGSTTGLIKRRNSK